MNSRQIKWILIALLLTEPIFTFTACATAPQNEVETSPQTTSEIIVIKRGQAPVVTDTAWKRYSNFMY